MGAQQLLLIVVGVIVVVLSIFTGLSIMKEYYQSSNRDQLISNLNNLGIIAQQHYKKPLSQGGGGNTYTGFTIPQPMRATSDGSFSVSVRSTRVDFTATGKEIGLNGRTVVRVTARADVNGVRITVTN